MATVGKLLHDARRRLAAASFEPPTREASLIAARLLDLSEAQLLARTETEVPPQLARRFEALLERRLGGEPFAYLFGEKEFFGRPFAVDRRVLIPRPETEHLVELALARLPKRGFALDVGTGCGCIAATLALERSEARLVATDVSPGALAVAAGNLRRHEVESRVHLLAASLLDPLRLRRFDLVVANLPYIDPQELAGISPEVRDFEPLTALAPAQSGLALIEGLLEQAAGRLARRSSLAAGTPVLLEIGYQQRPALEQSLVRSGFEIVQVHRDYAGVERVVELRWRRP